MRDILVVSSEPCSMGGEIERRLGGRVASIAFNEGSCIRVTPDRVLWDGVDLLAAGAILADLDLFPWPQPLLDHEDGLDVGEARAQARREREVRALAIAALRVAAEVRPVVNHPLRAHLAASPVTALDALGAAGLDVHGWSLEPLGTSERGALALDAAGALRGRPVALPTAGDPVLALDPFEEGPLEVLAIGAAAAGALVHADPATWADALRRSASRDQVVEGGALPAREVPGPARELALAAAGALGLEIAAVALVSEGGAPRVARVDAAPDLARWDTALGGRVADLLAEHLAARAAGSPFPLPEEARP